MISREEKVYPEMRKLLRDNGLQICLKTLIVALKDWNDEIKFDVEVITVLEGLKELHKGYCKRYEVKREKNDHWAVRLKPNGVYLVSCHNLIMVNVNWFSGAWFNSKEEAFNFKKKAQDYYKNRGYKFVVVRREILNMNRINWEWFFGNSSTEEAIVYFAKGKYTFKQFAENVNHYNECKKIVPLLKAKGYKNARNLAQRALKRRGFDMNDWDICVC